MAKLLQLETPTKERCWSRFVQLPGQGGGEDYYFKPHLDGFLRGFIYTGGALTPEVAASFLTLIFVPLSVR